MRRKISERERLKLKRGRCVVRNCKNPHGRKRLVCYMHMMQRYKKTHPLSYRYNVYAQNARKLRKRPLSFLKWQLKERSAKRRRNWGDVD